MNQTRITLKKSTIKLALLLMLFKLVLDLAYVYVVSPVYAYSGFTTSIQPASVLESYIIVFIIGLVLPSTIERASDFLIWMFGIGSLVPSLSYYAMHSGSRLYMYAMFLSFLCVLVVSKIPIIKIDTLKEGRTIGITVLVIMVFAVLASLIAKGGLSHFNLDLSKVYEFRRDDVSEAINIGVWAYINTWVFKVINPALIGWSLWQKKYRLAIAFIALQIVFFGISTHKGVLFYPVLILAVYWFVQQKKAFYYLTWGLISVVVFASCVSLIFDYNWLSSLFVRRVFFVPALLNFTYYELFSQIGHVYLSNSILSGFIHYPFDYGYTYMVSQFLYGHTITNCNNGFLATSFMHFGYLGMLIFSIIVGLLLWIVNILVTNRMPLWLGISILIMPFYSLFTSSDLFTAMLTHGIILALIILLLFGRKQNSALEVEMKGNIYEASLPSNLRSS